jgi:hypothetical protein
VQGYHKTLKECKELRKSMQESSRSIAIDRDQLERIESDVREMEMKLQVSSLSYVSLERIGYN